MSADLSFGSLVAFGLSPGPTEMFFILVIALLLYGGKLPEMARTWGKTLAEFRRSLSGIQSEINDAMYSTTDQLAIDQQEWQPEKSSPSSSDELDDETKDETSDETNDETSEGEEASLDDTSEV